MSHRRDFLVQIFIIFQFLCYWVHDIVVVDGTVFLSYVDRVSPSSLTMADDTLEALVLRYSFEQHQFLSQWRYLKQLGWKFLNPQYQAPNGRIFDEARQIQVFLDQSAVRDVYSSNLQWIDSRDHDDEETKESCLMRRDVLTTMLTTTTNETSGRTIGDDGPLDEHITIDVTTTMTTTVKKRATIGSSIPYRRSTRQRAERTSVTVQEKGSDMFFHKTSRSFRKRKAAVPSENSSGDVKLPSVEECQAFVASKSMDDVEGIEEMIRRGQFRDWRFILSTNHSLMIFGAGSKYNLLNSFANNELNNEGFSLLIDGFEEEVSVERIFDLLVEIFFEGKEPVSCDFDTESPVSAVNDIPIVGRSLSPYCHPREPLLVARGRRLSRAYARQALETLVPLFLVVHNFDALPNDNISQQALAAFVTQSTVPNGVQSIRLIASVDHVDTAATVWNDQRTKQQLAWIGKEVHTYRPYQKELVLIQRAQTRDSLYQSEQHRIRKEEQAARVLEVLQSIAPRHAEVVQILARLQIGDGNGHSDNKWVEYAVFRDACKKNYVVKRESELQPYLRELQDHRLIQFEKDEQSERLRIPYSVEKLHEIIAYQVIKGK